MKKKLILAIAMILCVAFLLSLASCGRKKKENETTKGTEQTSAQVNDVTEDDDKSNDVSESVTESDEVSDTSDEETTLGVYDSQGEAGSGFEITGEEITLPGVSADDDND